MSSLVGVIERKLDVSRDNAILRLVVIVAAVMGVIGLISWVLVSFPYQRQKTYATSLLPGAYTQVAGIVDGEVLMTRDQFLAIAASNPSFVAIGEYSIVYLTKKDGISYRHEQIVSFGDRRYGMTDYQALPENKVLYRLHRKVGDGIVFPIGLAAFGSFICLLLFAKASNKDSYSGRVERSLFD